mgnify:CR=1 FL=1
MESLYGGGGGMRVLPYPQNGPRFSLLPQDGLRFSPPALPPAPPAQVRHLEARGCAGIPPLPPVRSKPSASGAACEPRRVHGDRLEETLRLGLRLWPRHAVTHNTSLTSAASTAAAGAAGGAAAAAAGGAAAADPTSSSPSSTGSGGSGAAAGAALGGGAGDGAAVGDAHGYGSGGGERCYLFTVRPAMVQHVGAASALFGAVSQRFHVAMTFPERVAIPGLDREDTW